jgi:plasmid stability protein
MIRTSLYLPESLHQYLLVMARRQGRSVSELARDLFRRALAQSGPGDVLETYAALDRLEGIGDTDTIDASTMVDEVLYGEHGAWQGDRGETGLWTLAPQKVRHGQ